MEKNTRKLLISTAVGLAGLVLATSGKLNKNEAIENAGLLVVSGVAAYMGYKASKAYFRADRIDTINLN